MPKISKSIRKVKVGGLEIAYVLTRKAIKNMYLRVQVDGTIAVSANLGIPLATVDAFVKAKVDFILQARQRIATRSEQKEQLQEEIQKNKTIPVLGRSLAIVVLQGSKNSGMVEAERIVLTLRDVQNEELFAKVLNKALNDYCWQVFQDAIDRWCKIMQPYGVPQPQLKLRRMKSRWGSCNYRDGIITLNTRLLHMPRECLDHVVLHEYCHFFEHNHGPSFYAWMERFMPDWKERKKLLREWGERV